MITHSSNYHFINSTSSDILGIRVGEENYINNLKEIGKGTYGNIYQFDNTKKNDSYVVKKYIDD